VRCYYGGRLSTYHWRREVANLDGMVSTLDHILLPVLFVLVQMDASEDESSDMSSPISNFQSPAKKKIPLLIHLLDSPFRPYRLSFTRTRSGVHLKRSRNPSQQGRGYDLGINHIPDKNVGWNHSLTFRAASIHDACLRREISFPRTAVETPTEALSIDDRQRHGAGRYVITVPGTYLCHRHRC
jgi:hypothetical protein